MFLESEFGALEFWKQRNSFTILNTKPSGDNYWEIGNNQTRVNFCLLYDELSNGLKEFWPDIRRKVFHKEIP